jgi:hypothetical protein
MRKRTICVAATCVLALGTASTASADSEACFGAWTSNFAQNPITGGQGGLGPGLVPWVQAPGPFGTTALQLFKSVACG